MEVSNFSLKVLPSNFSFILAFLYSINGRSNPVTELIFSLDNPFDIYELACNSIRVFETSAFIKNNLECRLVQNNFCLYSKLHKKFLIFLV